MKPKIKKLWIQALRSGKYKKTTGQLRNGETFCCLGVLCDLYKHSTHRGRWAGDEFAASSHDPSIEGVLPTRVLKWAGLGDESDPMIKPRRDPRKIGGELSTLALLNDNGYGFKRIAAVIEKEL